MHVNWMILGELESIRAFNEWEIEEVNKLYSKLARLRLNEAVVDLMLWKLDKKGEFSGKSCYKLGYKRRKGIIQTLWDTSIPSRFFFSFALEACWGQIMTQDNLKKWNIALAMDATFANVKGEQHITSPL